MEIQINETSENEATIQGGCMKKQLDRKVGETFFSKFNSISETALQKEYELFALLNKRPEARWMVAT